MLSWQNIAKCEFSFQQQCQQSSSHALKSVKEDSTEVQICETFTSATAETPAPGAHEIILQVTPAFASSSTDNSSLSYSSKSSYIYYKIGMS